LTLDSSHRGLTVDVTANSFTISLTAAATLGSGWHCLITNSGTGSIVIDPNGAETIRTPAGTAATLTLSQGQAVTLACDGSNFDAVGCHYIPYLEGTFTPTVAGSTTPGTQTYNIQTGIYTRIGNRVFFDLYVNMAALDGTTAGTVLIKGLPFTSVATANNYPSVAIGEVGHITLSAGAYQITGEIPPSTAYVLLSQNISAAGVTALPAAALAANTYVQLSGNYAA